MCDRLLERKSLSVWSARSEQASVHSNSLIHISYLISCCLCFSITPSLLFLPPSTCQVKAKLFITRRKPKQPNKLPSQRMHSGSGCSPRALWVFKRVPSHASPSTAPHVFYMPTPLVPKHNGRWHTPLLTLQRHTVSVHRRRNPHAYTVTNNMISWNALNLLLISLRIKQMGLMYSY